ncbi:MAG: transglycosylase SLT domain-containing protein [Myxococcota bacterium]
MKRVWPLACCFGLLMGCHQQQHARPEMWPPQKAPAPVAAHAPAPPPKVLDPTLVEISDRSPVMQARRALDEGNPSKAREIAEAAVGQAHAQDKGRLHWLAGQAAAKDGYAQLALAHFDTLGGFNHPLSKWAKLRRAMLLERRDPVAANAIATELTDEWGGRDRAVAIVERLNRSPDAPAEVETPSTGGSATAKGRAKQTQAKAESFYRAKRYREAERLFGRVTRSAKPGSRVWCDARYKQARSLLQDRERTRGAPIMREVADRCLKLDADTRAWARYYGARAYGRIGQWDEAIRQFEQLEKEAPGHRLADDASYRSALAELENGHEGAARGRLATIANRYPEGDMWPRAIFRLGWLELRRGRSEEAFRHFDALVHKGGDEDEEGITGRAEYWRSRALFQMGRRLDAVQGYVEIAERWPLRYYAQQALRRLGEIVPDTASEILDDMRAGSEPSRMVFVWRDEFDDPAFERMTELLVVGDTTYATEEMRQLHMVGRGVDPEMAVVGAVLLQHAGAEAKLSRVIRDHFEDFEGLLPKGEGRLIWEATYPMAFSPLIEDVAETQGVPPAFVRAIAREESSFDPEAVSWAKAYGLVQLIMPTAKRFAPEVGEKATPRTLRRPEVNLKIGTAYMAWLWDRLEANPALVPSAYNAGEGAVRRWLEEDSSRPLDVFIEEIPYDETRRYTRRVLQTYGVYQWLADEQLPQLRSALPESTAGRLRAASR